MKKTLQTLILLVALLHPAFGAPLPIQVGAKYYIQIVDGKKELPFMDRHRPVKVINVFDYPWIEIEYTWTAQGVEPKVFRKYLNLDHVLVITTGEHMKKEWHTPTTEKEK
ncbi:MAG: hypothetical protein ACSHX8_11205 [Opitutaceae bacterium]